MKMLEVSNDDDIETNNHIDYDDNDSTDGNGSEYNNKNNSDDNQTTLSCMVINVGGLKSKLNFPSFINFIKNYDVIVITESNFSDTDSIQIHHFIRIEPNIGVNLEGFFF